MAGVGGAAAASVRAFAFAEPGADGRWGAAWLTRGTEPAGVLAINDQPSAEPLQLDGTGAGEPWRVAAGADTELVLEGLGDPAWSDPEARQEGFHQLCRVSGLAGGRPLESLGWRWAREPAIEPAFTSLRMVAGWFGEQDGFALAARRPGKAKGQDGDVIAAAIFDPAGSRAVADPRLSTTYTGSGQPTRAGVELWIEGDADPELLYPRRAVGQAVAPPVPWRVAEVAIEAQPFRWFSGDREAPGVYLLGQW
jgi:hypothetical protein